jgi:hypothetical protein
MQGSHRHLSDLSPQRRDGSPSGGEAARRNHPDADITPPDGPRMREDECCRRRRQMPADHLCENKGGLSMTDNIVSFEDCRLSKRGGTVFGISKDEVVIGSTIAGLEARMKERETVRDYIERMEIGEIMLHPDDGSAQSLLPVAHLLDLLSGYDDLLSREIGRLEYDREMLDLRFDD